MDKESIPEKLIVMSDAAVSAWENFTKQVDAAAKSYTLALAPLIKIMQDYGYLDKPARRPGRKLPKPRLYPLHKRPKRRK